MPNVSIPGVGVVAFPDTMTPEAIGAASKSLYEKASPKQPMMSAHGPEQRAITGQKIRAQATGGIGAVVRGMLDVPPASEVAASQRAASEGMVKSAPVFGRLLRESAPTMAAMGATALIPETAAVPGVVPWIARALARTTLAGGASTATDLAGQASSGEPLSLLRAAKRGGMDAAGQGAGELIGGAVGGIGNMMALDAAGATKSARMANPGIDEAILRERIPVGPKNAGQKVIQGLAAENATAMRAAEVANPKTHSVDDILSQVDHEIAQLRQSPHPEDAADALRLQARRDAFAAKNPNGLNNDQLDRAVRSSQQRASGTYTKDVNGKPVTVQTTPDEQMYHRLFARQGRAELRKVPGVAETKDRARELISLENVYRNREAATSPALPSLGDPMRAVPTILRRTLLEPAVASRVGFAMSDPSTLALLRNSPQAVSLFSRLLSAATASPDATTQGGIR